MDVALQRTKREELEKTHAAAKKRSKTLHRTEIEGKEGVERTWKICLYPDVNERKRLNQWMGIYRWTYNQCVAFYKQSGNLMKCPKIQTLSDNFVKSRSLEQAGKHWALDMLHNSRDKAVDDFVTAFKTNKKIYKEKLEKEK